MSWGPIPMRLPEIDAFGTPFDAASRHASASDRFTALLVFGTRTFVRESVTLIQQVSPSRVRSDYRDGRMSALESSGQRKGRKPTERRSSVSSCRKKCCRSRGLQVSGRSSTSPQMILPSAISPIAATTCVHRAIRKNYWWLLPENQVWLGFVPTAIESDIRT